ncbi:MAG: hypothetical protein OXU20_32100 [Myxococcales bacterium]|nr:hypothetical protein [Myxococcales bacterium]
MSRTRVLEGLVNGRPLVAQRLAVVSLYGERYSTLVAAVEYTGLDQATRHSTTPTRTSRCWRRTTAPSSVR